MDFAVLMPDWNSLDSVRRAHSDLEAAALVFFALLVLFDVLAHLSKNEERKIGFEKIGLGFFAVAVLAEIIAYPYGQRNDALSEQIIGSLDAKAQDAETKADKAVEKSGNALTRAENVEKSLGRAEGEAKSAQTASSNALALARDARQQAADALANLAEAKRLAEDAQKGTERLTQSAKPRRLSESQKSELVRLLSDLPPFTVVFAATRSGSDEVLDFTDDFIDVFIRLKLIPADSSSRKLERAIGAAEGRGVIIAVMGQTEHPRVADVLITTLRSWGFEANGELAPKVVKTATEIDILIGAKQ